MEMDYWILSFYIHALHVSLQPCAVQTSVFISVSVRRHVRYIIQLSHLFYYSHFHGLCIFTDTLENKKNIDQQKYPSRPTSREKTHGTWKGGRSANSEKMTKADHVEFNKHMSTQDESHIKADVANSICSCCI